MIRGNISNTSGSLVLNGVTINTTQTSVSGYQRRCFRITEVMSTATINLNIHWTRGGANQSTGYWEGYLWTSNYSTGLHQWLERGYYNKGNYLYVNRRIIGGWHVIELDSRHTPMSTGPVTFMIWGRGISSGNLVEVSC